MLKKSLSYLGYLALIIGLGLVIRYFADNFQGYSAKSDYSNISTAPLFAASLPNAQGQTQNLSQYQGKVVVLNFWATWCPPCREEMPELSRLQQAYQGKNVVVLGIAMDELDSVEAFLQTTPVSYPILVANDPNLELDSKLGNNEGVLPYTMIINADGKVVKTFFGRISKSLLEPAITPLLLK